MKKIVIALSIILIFFAGCSSNSKIESSKSSDKIPVVTGAEGMPRPQWVMSGKESADGIYAVGSGKMSNRKNSLTVARTNGRSELLRTVQTTIKSAITTYALDTGIPDDMLTSMEQATVDRTAGILQGSVQKDYWVDKDETVYVLMFLPYNAVVPAANNIVSEYVTDKKSEITEQKVAEALKKYRLLDTSSSDEN